MSTAVSNILDQQAPRLLVVDDEPIILDCFWQFALCRVDAITTTTGIETIQAAYQHNPGLITMDVSLPCMDGSRSFSNYAITASILQ